MTFAEACYTLAEQFLTKSRDQGFFENQVIFEAHCHVLALKIEQAIEDYMKGKGNEIRRNRKIPGRKTERNR